MSDIVLELQDVSKTYPSEAEVLRILNGASLALSRGEKIAITGESGCGKSTLLNIIGGLDTPDAGTIQAGSFSVHALSERDLARYRSSYLGLVFQFHYLLKDFSALENVMLPAFMAGVSRKEALERAKELLADVGLEHRLHHFPSQLSGGERQRAAVARALVNRPALMLADEPTGNLDPANALMIQDVLFSAADRHNASLIIVTHDPAMASRADHLYRLQEGRLVRS